MQRGGEKQGQNSPCTARDGSAPNDGDEAMGISPMRRVAAAAMAGAALALPLAGTSALAGTIDKIKADQAIRIAYRPDAPPFSSKPANAGEPSGFMIDLCNAVAKKLAVDLGVPNLKVVYVAVTAENRLEAIRKQEADMLCEPTTATLERRAIVDFSIATFADGIGIMTRDKNVRDLVALTGRKIGVLAGTTAERAVRGKLSAAGIPAEFVLPKTHDEGLAMLDDGAISAYFADRAILISLRSRSKAPDQLAIANNYLSVEPYALALPRGDTDFRLAVDTALSHIYRDAEIQEILGKTFPGRPSDILEALYIVSGLPD
jgi:ABC-type amino acid transport substrate-binding protein